MKFFKTSLGAFELALGLLLLSILASFIPNAYQNTALSLPDLSVILLNGMWSASGVVFMLQMMLMLLFGQSLATTDWFSRKMDSAFVTVNHARQAYVRVALISLVGCWLNWGLGLVLGALASKTAARVLNKHKKPFNYGFLAALGYSGMMLWHSGLSGSSTLKAAEPAALAEMAKQENLAPVPLSETVFNPINLLVSIVLVLAVLLFAYTFKAKEKSTRYYEVNQVMALPERKNYRATVLGIILLMALIFGSDFDENLRFITPNFVITTLLALLLLALKDLQRFTAQVERNLKSSAGILLQFPIYFAIMALLSHNGWLSVISHGILDHVSVEALPFGTFYSAAFVNFMVPSGGGQWLLQGPLILESCTALGLPISSGILAFAYGDALTNMLQPFWALPLLGITQLHVRDLWPYTLRLFLIGLVVYTLGIAFM